MTAPSALFISQIWPEAVSSAGGVRTLSLIQALLNARWVVHFVSPSPENDFSAALRRLGVQTQVLGPNDSRFDDFIQGLKPDVAIFDRFMLEEQFGWRVQEHSPQTLRVLDTIDLHFLRKGRQEALRRGASLGEVFDTQIDFGAKDAPGHEDALREIAAIYRSDISLLVSDFECRLLESRFGLSPELLFYSPFFFPTPDRSASPAREERKNFVSIGNFRHPPNTDAVRWLREKIWPGIRQRLPTAEAHIYGSYPTREIMALTDTRNGFLVKGPAREAVPTLRDYRVNLAPLRFGGGIKGKIADGWLAGTPTVTTPIGAEGMTPKSGIFPGLVARTEAELIEACVNLYEDPVLWEKSQIQAFEACEELFDETKNSKNFLNLLDQARQQLKERRSRNFIGAMLGHHHHRSTTYFSRWIETKNRLKSELSAPQSAE